MTREEKYELVNELSEKFSKTSFFYIADASGMTVQQTTKFRRMCFEKGIECNVVKNSLIKKALEKMDADYSPFNSSVLKGFSAILFSPESGKEPALVIQEFRKANKLKSPLLKGASIDTALFIGDNQLETLAKIKSKDEVIGEIIHLLQSPARRVISAVTSGGSRVAGMVKGIAEKGN